MSGADENTVNVRSLPAAGLRMIVIAALIVVLAGCGAGGPESAGQEGQGTSGTSETREQSSANDSELGAPALGDPGAPVVMVEYADYQ